MKLIKVEPKKQRVNDYYLDWEEALDGEDDSDYGFEDFDDEDNSEFISFLGHP